MSQHKSVRWRGDREHRAWRLERGDRRRGKSAVFERSVRSPLTVKRRTSTSGSRGKEQDFLWSNKNRNIVCTRMNETEYGKRRAEMRLATVTTKTDARFARERKRMKSWLYSRHDKASVILYSVNTLIPTIYMYVYACIHDTGRKKKRRDERCSDVYLKTGS